MQQNGATATKTVAPFTLKTNGRYDLFHHITIVIFCQLVVEKISILLHLYPNYLMSVMNINLS